MRPLTPADERLTPLVIGRLRRADLPAIVKLDAALTGKRKPAYWKAVLPPFVSPKRSRVGLVARHNERVVGFLLGEVRAFEFGSPPCGWIFAVGVDSEFSHHGIGSALLAEAARQFARSGLSTIRTMVWRNDVQMLSFFRSNGFVGGSFTQLERELTPAAEGAR